MPTLGLFVVLLLAMTRKWPLAGPFLCRASVAVAMFDDHDLVVMMPPTLVPAAIAMFAEFGTGAEPVMIAMLDHDGLGARD